jgi:hypothetical protein
MLTALPGHFFQWSRPQVVLVWFFVWSGCESEKEKKTEVLLGRYIYKQSLDSPNDINLYFKGRGEKKNRSRFHPLLFVFVKWYETKRRESKEIHNKITYTMTPVKAGSKESPSWIKRENMQWK